MISEYSMKLSAELGNVQITPDGIAAAITASFEATETDPEVADIPGTPLSLAPMPQPPIPGADESPSPCPTTCSTNFCPGSHSPGS